MHVHHRQDLLLGQSDLSFQDQIPLENSLAEGPGPTIRGFSGEEGTGGPAAEGVCWSLLRMVRKRRQFMALVG
jgi:hypothetical protein